MLNSYRSTALPMSIYISDVWFVIFIKCNVCSIIMLDINFGIKTNICMLFSTNKWYIFSIIGMITFHYIAFIFFVDFIGVYYD